MQIEIHTAKKKLSKALINQMKFPTIPAMRNGYVVGYMINVRKDSYKSVLIEYDSEYFVIDSGWMQGVDMVVRKVGRLSRQYKLGSVEKCEEWWSAYCRVLADVKVQIYV